MTPQTIKTNYPHMLTITENGLFLDGFQLHGVIRYTLHETAEESAVLGLTLAVRTLLPENRLHHKVGGNFDEDGQ